MHSHPSTDILPVLEQVSWAVHWWQHLAEGSLSHHPTGSKKLPLKGRLQGSRWHIQVPVNGKVHNRKSYRITFLYLFKILLLRPLLPWALQHHVYIVNMTHLHVSILIPFLLNFVHISTLIFTSSDMNLTLHFRSCSIVLQCKWKLLLTMWPMYCNSKFKFMSSTVMFLLVVECSLTSHPKTSGAYVVHPQKHHSSCIGFCQGLCIGLCTCTTSAAHVAKPHSVQGHHCNFL